MTAKEIFFNWLIRKYGWGQEEFTDFEESFQNSLLEEFNDIRRSYGQTIIYIEELKERES